MTFYQIYQSIAIVPTVLTIVIIIIYEAVYQDNAPIKVSKPFFVLCGVIIAIVWTLHFILPNNFWDLTHG